MINPKTLRHRVHGFSPVLEHQALEVVAGGGALVFADQGGKDLDNELTQVIWGVEGGCRARDQTLRRCDLIHNG